MKLEEVKKIVNDYGKALGIASQMSFGAPESLLPSPKKTIKNAIKLYLVILSKLNKLDEKFKNHLMMGYAHLADFIPDEKAKIGLNVQASMLESAAKINNKDMGDPKKLAEAASNLNPHQMKSAIGTAKQTEREFNKIYLKLRNLSVALSKSKNLLSLKPLLYRMSNSW